MAGSFLECDPRSDELTLTEPEATGKLEVESQMNKALDKDIEAWRLAK
jgi:hypothetical protein